MATTNLTPANALMKAFMKSGSRPTQADDVEQDVERILGRLGSTQANKAKYTPGPTKTATSQPVALNGAAVLYQALGGAHGSVNGNTTNSVAALISDQLSGRHDHSG
ncbi:hypothetical protein [Rhodococcus opacus]|uniref:hypothetical protein n=1 Tax=Rhodococcus opacus TaxID=37919 RepID=UPI0022366563|nr:hypothetical protein [Rhodococcus opacus]UZG58233.1 hypothetical protein ONE62_13340 [Rhodococcus opacus]